MTNNQGLSGFQWDKGNRAKCQKHGLAIETIEEIFSSGVIILSDEKDYPDFSK